MYEIDWRDIPVYICNRNNLDRGFRRLVTWLLDHGMHHVNIVDNRSTYQPLLDFYEEMKDRITVQVQEKNIGPRGWWELGNHQNIMTPYIYTDCDVVPADICPEDVIEQMLALLRKQETGRKVGIGLRIDNLPDHYSKKELVVLWESRFWHAHLKDQVNNEYADTGRAFNANVDTTFALYHPQQPFTYTALRMDTPYVFEHVPWYADDSNLTEEDRYYKEHYETAHEGGQKWKTDDEQWGLYGWSVRSKTSLEKTLRVRGVYEESVTGTP